MANIKEIAEMAGVSVKTVTRAFKKDAVIDPKTRKKILDLAKEYNYRPNRAAGRLAAKPLVIGICLAGSTEFFNKEFISGINDAAKQLENSRITLIFRHVCYTSNEDTYLDILEEFKNSGVSGIITTFSNTVVSEKIAEKYRELNKKNVRIVLLNNENRKHYDFCITSNIAMTGKIAAELMSLIAPNGNNIVFTGEMCNSRHTAIADLYRENAEKRNLRVSGVYDLDNLPYDICGIFGNIEKNVGKIDSIYITTGNSERILAELETYDPERHIKAIISDILPHTTLALKSGRVSAIIYQNPFKQARLSLLKLYSVLAEDATIAPCIEIVPQIILQSNIDWYN